MKKLLIIGGTGLIGLACIRKGLKKKYKVTIYKKPLVKKMTKQKSFCSLIVGKDQDILFEQYAKDFSTNQPQTIMSITKMFIHLFVGELIDRKLINLNKKISFETSLSVKLILQI